MTAGLDRLLTPDEVADVLRLPTGVAGVYELTRKRSRNRLEALRVGKYLRVRESALRSYLARAGEGVAR